MADGGLLRLAAEEDGEGEAEVVEGGAGADDEDVDAAVVELDAGAPSEGGIADTAAVGDHDLRGTEGAALAIDGDVEAVGLVAEEPAQPGPDIGQAAEAALVVPACIAHDDPTEADADVEEEETVFDPEGVDGGDGVVAGEELQGGPGVEGNAEFPGEGVAGPEGDDAEGNAGVDEAPGDGGDGAVAPGGDDKVGAVVGAKGGADDVGDALVPRGLVDAAAPTGALEVTLDDGAHAGAALAGHGVEHDEDVSRSHGPWTPLTRGHG